MNRPDRCDHCGKKLWLKDVTLFYTTWITGKKLVLCPQCYVEIGGKNTIRFIKIKDEWVEEEIHD
jgi:hypothetical protein